MNDNYSLNKDDEKKIEEAIIKEIYEKPPTIGLIGVSGTGKSSTINAMFKTDLPISHVVACTKEFRSIDLDVTVQKGEAKGQEAILRVVDAPGLGEDISLDPAYLNMYRKNLIRCDVILWVLTARNRAIALDQMYLKELKQFHDKMVFGINQVDLVEPRNWSTKINLPSEEQEKNIGTIVADRKEKIESVMGRKISITAYSAQHKYQLQQLFTELIEASPKHRAWIFSALKAFNPEDFLPADARDKIKDILSKR